MNIKLLGLAPLALIAILASGCASDGVQDPAGGSTTGGDTATTSGGTGTDNGTGASTSGTTTGGSTQMDPLDDPSSLLAKRVIYFEFDSARIAPEFEEVLTAHARLLAANPDLAVVLEGHADERGSREYNLALGERRANAVNQLFTIQGVAARQTDVVSYGEERPAALGHDESSWHLNRRVEIVYQGR